MSVGLQPVVVAYAHLDVPGQIAQALPYLAKAAKIPAVEIIMAPADDGTDGALLPVAAVARVGDLEVAGRYVPAGAGPEPVAGDFWDVLELPAGRVGMFVGDVTGHGVQAVGRMRALRSTARACAVLDLGPAALMRRLDDFMDQQGPEEMATLWYGEYDPVNGELVHASAGHPPPAVVMAGRPPALLDVTDAPPLGTGVAHTQAREHHDVLPAGAVLVAYSDGLIERRRSDIGDGLERLSTVLAQACDRTSGSDQIAQEVLQALVPEPERAEDDVCLLVVRRLA